MRFQLSLFALASAAFVAAQDLPDLPSDVPQCFVSECLFLNICGSTRLTPIASLPHLG